MMFDSPVGPLWAEAGDRGVTKLWFVDRPPAQEPSEPQNLRVLEQLERELDAYWQKRLKAFTVELDLRGTPFQLRVWNALLAIPFGETWTYTQQTALLGDPLAIRAVASANGKNPVAIVVPCHRVIGSDGSLTGYAGGMERKRALLHHEGWAPKGQFELL